MYNPLSGYQAPGPRFKVRIRPLAHNNMYLPIKMRTLPQIILLLKGISPLEVFNCTSIKDARQAFYELRKKFDFPYWAVREFKIRDIANLHKIVPLRLNRFQHYLADSLIRNNPDDLPAKYIISKTIPRCGLTTCVQAYIIWLQLYHLDHSIICAPSESMMETMKADVARSIHKKAYINRIFLNDQCASAFYQSFFTPNVLDRVPSRFVHLADMSKWHDPSAEVTNHILSNALNGWKRQEGAIFVIMCPLRCNASHLSCAQFETRTTHYLHPSSCPVALT